MKRKEDVKRYCNLQIKNKIPYLNFDDKEDCDVKRVKEYKKCFKKRSFSKERHSVI